MTEGKAKRAPAPPDAAAAGRLRPFRHYCAAAGFTDVAIARTIGVGSFPDVMQVGAERVLARTASDVPQHVLIRLLLHGAPAAVETVTDALPAGMLDDLVAAGVVAFVDGAVRPLARIFPHDGLLVASDLSEVPGGGVERDHVMAIAGSTVGLADFTVRRPVARALDVGTGGGVHALLAARHAEHVVAVDTNQRALQFAAFNCALNEIRNVELHAGDMFGATEGAEFDLIVSNPPFVIGPHDDFEFRDSGVGGDTFCETLVRRAPGFLREGGLCQLLVNWAHVRGERWQDRLRSWVTGSGCDAWVLRLESKRPADYVDMYIMDAERVAGAKDAWLADMNEAGIEAVSIGFVFLRRRGNGTNWFRIDDAPARFDPPVGEHVLRIFAGRTHSSSASDDQLLTVPLSVAPDVRFSARTEAENGGFSPLVATLRLAGGLGYTADVEGALAALVLELDGTRTVAEVLAGMARAGGFAVDDVLSSAAAGVRTLLERGFLGLAD